MVLRQGLAAESPPVPAPMMTTRELNAGRDVGSDDRSLKTGLWVPGFLRRGADRLGGGPAL